MKKWHVYGAVTGSTYVGVFKAETKEEAEKLAWKDADVSVCNYCSKHIEDPEISELTLMEITDGDEE